MTKVLVITSNEELRSHLRESLPEGLQVSTRHLHDRRVLPADLTAMIAASGCDIALLGPDLAEQLVLNVARALRKSNPEIDCVAYRQPTSKFLGKAIHSGLRDVVGPRHGFDGLRETLVLLGEAAELRRANLLADASVKGLGGTVTVVGPKGGVGKTTVAVNLAYLLARDSPNDAVLVDLDLIGGGVADALQIETSSNVVSAARDRCYEDPTALKLSLTSHPSGLLVLPAPTSLAEAEQLRTEDVVAMLRLLSSHFRHVVVDTGPGSTDVGVAAALQADQMLAVATPEIGGLKTLARHLEGFDTIGMRSGERRIVLNKADPRTGVSNEDVEAALRAQVEFSVPFDRQLVVAGNQGMAFVELKPRGPTADAFEALTTALTGQRAAPVAPQRKWFR